MPSSASMTLSQAGVLRARSTPEAAPGNRQSRACPGLGSGAPTSRNPSACVRCARSKDARIASAVGMDSRLSNTGCGYSILYGSIYSPVMATPRPKCRPWSPAKSGHLESQQPVVGIAAKPGDQKAAKVVTRQLPSIQSVPTSG